MILESIIYVLEIAQISLKVQVLERRITQSIQVHGPNGPVTSDVVLSLGEIEMQWICMASRGRAGRPDHPSYDPSNEEWSDCNMATDNRVTPIIVLFAILNINC